MSIESCPGPVWLEHEPHEDAGSHVGFWRGTLRQLMLLPREPRPKSEWRAIANEVPEFLELSGQPVGGDPYFLVPEDTEGNVPVLEDRKYRRALWLAGTMELPSKTIAERRRKAQLSK